LRVGRLISLGPSWFVLLFLCGGCDLNKKADVDLEELTRTEILAVKNLCDEADAVADEQKWKHWDGLDDCTSGLERGAQMFKGGCGTEGVFAMLSTIEECLRQPDYDESDVDECVERNVGGLQSLCGI
jgi:hypothetical protein